MTRETEPCDQDADLEWTEEHRIHRFRKALLRRTLRHAVATVPFYRTFQGRPTLDIDEFPFVDPALFREREDEFLNLEAFPDELLTTGGTTGSPGLLYGSALDRRLLFRHLYGRREEAHDPELLEQGFVVHIDTAHHGFALHPGGGAPIAHVPLESPAHARMIWRLVRDGILVRDQRVRANCLIGSISLIRILSEYLRGLDIHPRGAVPFVCGTSWHTPPLLQEELAEFWNARIVTNYGLTEFSNAAMFPCQDCGSCHVPDVVYPEYYRPDRKTRVESGAGVLVLTSLYPFVRMQPRIRYWTGDLVHLGEPCPATGRPGITFEGRANHCLLAQAEEGLRTVFSPVMVSNALFALPHAHHDFRSYQFYMEAVEPPTDSPFRPGRPIFGFQRLDAARNEVDIAVELDFAPASDRRLSERLQQQFLEAMREQVAARQGKVAIGVTLLGPGELRKQRIEPVRA